MNPDRRDRLRDAAVEVLARDGGRGLTHRAVDRAAEVPPGTAKNYFPTRDAVLRAVAERCLEQYLALTGQLAATQGPTDREGLTVLFRSLLENVAGPGRSRLLAVLELQAEATRRPWLSGILDPMASGDFAGFELAQRSAGLPVTPQRAAVVTLALHAAIPHLLTNGPATLAASGLDDVDRFVRDLLNAVYPPEATA
ncbi:TetR/AcrR family transcriptional regulator [Streptomyces anulatus]|uniref:TetR/AcrR family transcriptional regulator n=1 Tax=Streptomyces TaxID=1883 RepID=UPI001B369023|nr:MULTISPECIES: TetR family transcriptional regulator [Streptomyces]MBQ1105705.1 TetR family transcriptional regulator [Streptomyces sp. 404i]MBQ1116605.1 TetR family transcriptional regulator [Streptomyces sp. C3-3]WIY78939.1 TetR family transcriptional regulator [Streptomyces anulatus]